MKPKVQKLLAETQSQIKGKSKDEISKLWQNYRKQKFQIVEYPKYRAKARKVKDVVERAALRQRYFDRKSTAVEKLEYGTLKLAKRTKQKYSTQDFYNLKRGKLDNTVKKIFDKGKARYILVTLKLRLSDGSYQYVSDTLTPALVDRLRDMDVSIMEKVLEKLSFVKKYDGFQLISQHLRLIYANPEKTENKKVT